jgi:FKBP-type peptidyl-prolyl cis-trans isomerase SlpA
MNQFSINEKSRVTLHFSLKLENGDIVDSNFEKKPASFVYGDGSLLPTIERKLLGMIPGDKRTFTILPEDGFGQPNPNNVQQFARSDFSADLELTPGLMLSFADANKAELPGVVSEIHDDYVLVDFNHPLAGHTLQFDVEIIAVERL